MCGKRSSSWRGLRRVALGLHRRGRFRDQRACDACRSRSAKLLATPRLRRSGSGRVTVCVWKRASVSMAPIWIRPRLRSKRRSNGASRQAAGTAAGVPVGFPAPTGFSNSSKPARRDGASACVRRGVHRFATARNCFPTVPRSGAVGTVTSGGFGPSVNAPIAMGYVTASAARADAPIFAELRGERVPVRLAPMPFIAPKYKR